MRMSRCPTQAENDGQGFLEQAALKRRAEEEIMLDRIENIEIHCDYLQKNIDELSGVVIEQQKEIFR